MSFSLQPADGSARLLGPAPARRQGVATSDGSERIQGAIQAINCFAAEVRKEARKLSANSRRSSSAQHVKQVASAARETIVEVNRWLREMEAGSQKVPKEEHTRLRLYREKFSGNLAQAAAELERSWQEFVAADAVWVQSQTALAAAGEDPSNTMEDLEAPPVAELQQVRETEFVTQAEVDLHSSLVDEYAREVREVSRNIHGLQRAMVDLAEHTRSQGSVLEGIEANIDRACEKASEALEQIQVAEERQRRGMRWTYYLTAVVSTVSAGMVAAVYH